MQWSSNIGGFPVDQDPIAINPSTFDVIHIVVYDESIGGMDQLPVADVRKEIGLHDGKFHCRAIPIARDARLMTPQIRSTSALLSPIYIGKQSTREEILS